MADQMAVAAAQKVAAELLRYWAMRAFPGVTELADRVHTHGAGGDQAHLTGNWNGVWLSFSATPNSSRGEGSACVVALCDCCGKFAPDFDSGPVPGLESLTDFARAYTTDPRASMPQCFHCQWLHPAQRAAGKVGRSKFARWRFRVTHDRSVEQVLAEHRHAAA